MTAPTDHNAAPTADYYGAKARGDGAKPRKNGDRARVRRNSPEAGLLSVSLPFDIRFSEVDSMQFVWHGSYALYFEDAREAFGRRYGLDYLTIFHNGFYTPLVDLQFHYRQPLVYGMKPRIDIYYVPTEAAKIVFDYEIRDTADNRLLATGRSVQVFLDKDYRLVWTNPDFYDQWKKKWLTR